MFKQPCDFKNIGPSFFQQVVKKIKNYTFRQKIKKQKIATLIFIHKTNSKNGKKNVNAIINNMINKAQ